MEWISVKDGVPEARSYVLVKIKNSGIWGAFYKYWGDESLGNEWDLPRYDCDAFNWENEEITHWMPLPEPPMASDL